MTKNQIEEFDEKRREIEQILFNSEKMLKNYYAEERKHNLSCDHKYENGDLARGYRGNWWLCHICHCGADFDTLEKRK